MHFADVTMLTHYGNCNTL